MDRIFLSGMKIYGHHGYTPEEREIGQALEVDHLAADIARQALSGLPCQAATVRVSKLNPPVGGVCERAAVEMRRTRQDFGL